MCFNPSIINEHAHLPDKQRGDTFFKNFQKIDPLHFIWTPHPVFGFFSRISFTPKSQIQS